MSETFLRDWKAMGVCLCLAVLVWWLVEKKPGQPAGDAEPGPDLPTLTEPVSA